MLPSYSFGKSFDKVWLSLVIISPVSVADKAKSDNFDLQPGMWPFMKMFENCSKSAHRELSCAVSPVSLRPSVCILCRGGGGAESAPPRGAFGRISLWARVNPCPAGGADSALPPPLAGFRDSSKTAADIDTKLSVPSPASVWRLPSKFQKNTSRFLFRKWRFSDVMFRDFGSKSGKCLNPSRKYRFEVKQNP